MRGSALLERITVADLVELVTTAEWVRFHRGHRLTVRGSRPGNCWLLLAGYVKEHRPLDDGSEAVNGFRGPGDLFGEIAVLLRTPYDHDVTALGSGEALAFTADQLHAVLIRAPGLEAAMLRAVASRAVWAESALARNDLSDTSQRVALAILELAEQWGIGTTSSIHISVPLSQAELAEWIGVSRETVAKALQRLRAGGLVATSRRRLVINDLDGLRRAAHLVLRA